MGLGKFTGTLYQDDYDFESCPDVVSVFQIIKLTMRTFFLNAMQKIYLIVFHVWGVLLQGGREHMKSIIERNGWTECF